jgi:hypothetical protein
VHRRVESQRFRGEREGGVVAADVAPLGDVAAVPRGARPLPPCPTTPRLLPSCGVGIWPHLAGQLTIGGTPTVVPHDGRIRRQMYISQIF